MTRRNYLIVLKFGSCQRMFSSEFLHTGHQGTSTYTVNDSELPAVQTHGDLIFIITEDLKTAPYC